MYLREKERARLGSLFFAITESISNCYGSMSFVKEDSSDDAAFGSHLLLSKKWIIYVDYGRMPLVFRICRRYPKKLTFSIISFLTLKDIKNTFRLRQWISLLYDFYSRL